MGNDAGQRGRASGLTDRRVERGALDQLISAVRAGVSRVLVVRGEPGVGKTALLDYLAAQAPGCRVARAAGVESEMELAFAGLHQLLTPMLNRLVGSPARNATRCGSRSASAPARRRTGSWSVWRCLGCSRRWPPSGRWSAWSMTSSGWTGRRCRRWGSWRGGWRPIRSGWCSRPDSRVGAGRAAGAPLSGLGEEDARALLESALTGPVDARVTDLIIAETRGTRWRCLSCRGGWRRPSLRAGSGCRGRCRCRDGSRRASGGSWRACPSETRRLLALAAADPSGDPLLVWRAAGRLGIPVQAAAPASRRGLVEFGAQVRFRHPLARSAAYRSASAQQMKDVHARAGGGHRPGG